MAAGATVARSDGTRKRRPGGPVATIPDKLYFRIGEVARLLDLPPYVLRFWESEFPQLRPNKGGTGQRLYRRRDVEAVQEIRRLLYDEGYTIPGARQYLKESARAPAPQAASSVQAPVAEPRAQLNRIRHELLEISGLLGRTPVESRRNSPRARLLPAQPRRRSPDAPLPLFAVPPIREE